MNLNSQRKSKDKQSQNESEKLRKCSSELSLFEQSSTSNEKEKIRKMRPSSTYDALSLEQQLVWEDGRITETFTLRHYQLPSGYTAAVSAVKEILEDILDYVVDTAERKRREQIVENYLTRAIPAPLVSRDEVQILGQSLSTSSISLQSNTVRLQAAWKLILVSTGQQLCLSFRRILEKYDCALQNKLEEEGFEPRSLLTDSSSGILIRLIKDRCRIYIDHRKKRTRSREQTLQFMESNKQQIQSDVAENKDDESRKVDDKEVSKVEEVDDKEVSKVEEVYDDETEQEFERALVKYFNDQEQETCNERQESDYLVEMISSEAYTELQEVTDRCLSLAVEYLKNATFNLVEEASQDIKQIVYSSTTH